MFIEQEKANYSVKRMCLVLEVSKSGYYAWCGRGVSKREEADAELVERIKTIHEKSRGIYGAPRIHAELRDEHQIRCSRKRVARLMREAGVVGVHRRKYQGTTQRDPKRDPYPDRVERQFTADEPNRLWVADATQHETDEGWLFLAVIIDVYYRLVVGWSMGERFTAELVLNALEMALWNRQPAEGVIHHSDHGSLGSLDPVGLSQYTSLAFGQGLENIPDELYEAANLDGSNAFQNLVYITAPLLRPITLLITVLSITLALQVFGEVYLLTDGGPFGSTRVLTFLLYEAGFTNFEFGRAAALGVIMTLLIALLALVQFKFLGER